MKQGRSGTRKATSKNDEYYTHNYAIKPILKYIKPNSIIWCPFDTEQSNYVCRGWLYEPKVGYFTVLKRQ
jgi:hypothetical protein